MLQFASASINARTSVVRSLRKKWRKKEKERRAIKMVKTINLTRRRKKSFSLYRRKLNCSQTFPKRKVQKEIVNAKSDSISKVQS